MKYVYAPCMVCFSLDTGELGWWVPSREGAIGILNATSVGGPPVYRDHHHLAP